MNKIYEFTDNKGHKFTARCSEIKSKQLKKHLNSITDAVWTAELSEVIMQKYNDMITSAEYGRQVEQYKTYLAGTNLRIKVEDFHTRLGIYSLGNKAIYEKYEI